MIRKHKKFSRPKHQFDSERMKSEDVIVSAYGLKNKKEIWKAKAKLDIIRKQAKKLINASEDEQKPFLEKLQNLGFKVGNPAEVLALTEEDILKRRLQTIILKKNLAAAPKQARQLITHKHIAVNGRKVGSPSYMVKVDEENKIEKIMKVKKVRTPAEKVEEAKEIVEEVKAEEPKVEEVKE